MYDATRERKQRTPFFSSLFSSFREHINRATKSHTDSQKSIQGLISKRKQRKMNLSMKTNISVDFRKLISDEKFKTQHNKRRFKSRSNQKVGSCDTLG
jgi:hypothetical protein